MTEIEVLLHNCLAYPPQVVDVLDGVHLADLIRVDIRIPRLASPYPNGVDVAVRLMGDDEWFDDLLYAVPGSTYESPGSNHFGRELHVSGGTLNEDWGRTRPTPKPGCTTTAPAGSSRRSGRT